MRMSDIIERLKGYLVLGIVATIFVGIIFFVAYKIIYQKIMKGNKKIEKKKILLYGITIFYATIVLGAVFLNRARIFGVANLHLFSSYREAYNKMEISSFRNNILNILLFVPLGFLLPIYSDKLKKIYKVLPLGFAATLIIEIIQYTTKLGIFEIDDIFNNTYGVLIGYCLFMIFYSLIKKENYKYIALYILPTILIIALFVGIYVKYENQELGNFALEYIYKINMKNVDIENSVELSTDRSIQNIYHEDKLVEKKIEEIAKNIFEKLGTEIGKTDLVEDMPMYYSADEMYAVRGNDETGMYSFTDFSILYFNSNPQKNATREELEAALQKLGININKSAKFEEVENSKSHSYKFSIDGKVQGDNLIVGKIECAYYADEKIKYMNNSILEYEKINEKEIISEKEAYDEILKGKFFYYEHYFGKIKKIDIKNVELKYVIDTKGYVVPFYVFDTKINDEDWPICIRAVK